MKENNKTKVRNKSTFKDYNSIFFHIYVLAIPGQEYFQV